MQEQLGVAAMVFRVAQLIVCPVPVPNARRQRDAHRTALKQVVSADAGSADGTDQHALFRRMTRHAIEIRNRFV
ncbi:MAG: hypothetical protein BGO47_06505 [Microbacterium sp. 67-17]|nr:MAG: hypothetical protein BGO47_06505 [Microbacterium sp. 67-17]